MNSVTQWEAKEIIREKNATIEAQAAEIERLKRERAVVDDLLEQQQGLALKYLFDCNEAVAENERLREALMDCWLKHDEPTAVDMIASAALAGKAEQ
jgi:hypothetical protein